MSMFIIFFPIFFSLVESILTNALLVPILEKATKVRIFHRVHIYLKFLEKSLLCYVFCYIHIYRTVWWFVAELTAEKFQIVSIFNVDRITRIAFIFFYYFPAPWTRQENDLSQLHESSYIAWYVPMYFSRCTYTYACIRPARALQFFASNMVGRGESI